MQGRLKSERLFLHPAMRLLERAISRDLLLQFAASLGLFILGAYIAYDTYADNLPLMTIGLAIALIAGKLLEYSARNLRKGRNSLLQVLREQPLRVVWVYSVVLERVPFGIYFFRTATMFFKLDDGTELSVHLPYRHLRTVSHFLNRLLPHATFGYTSDRDYAYRVSPERLRREDWKDTLNG
ncbi:MAG: hypothetical protein ACOYOO_00560 [Saprospiraceae bacterium]|jgi:hypothetical protein